MNEHSNRRDFLKGKSTVRAIQKAVNDFEIELSPAVSSVPETRQAAYLEEYSKSAMACQFEVIFNLHQYEGRAASATMEVFELLDQLEDQMSVYREHSEVSQLNQNGFAKTVRVETRLFDLLTFAKELNEATNGAFDITSGVLSSIWGFQQRKGAVPSDQEIKIALDNVGSDWLVFDEDACSVKFTKPNLKVNLGGIGKGHAIDRMVGFLCSKDVHDFVIHGGQSSVYAAGHQKRLQNKLANAKEVGEAVVDSVEEQGWPIGLSHPNYPDRRLAEFFLSNCALGTSGTGRQGFFHQGKKYGHIIDPRTGWPTDHHLSTTVITSSAAKSDALATAFFVMTTEEIEDFCRTHTDVATVLVDQAKNKREHVELTWFNLDEKEWRRV